MTRDSELEYYREYRRTHPEQNKAAAKRYYERHNETVKAQHRSYSAAHREAENAHSLAQDHLKEVQPCSVEGCGKTGERHHPDYAEPLRVVWLCRSHHRLWHQSERNNVLFRLLAKQEMKGGAQ